MENNSEINIGNSKIAEKNSQIVVTEGKLSSTEKQHKDVKPLGEINVPKFGRYEFFIPNNILDHNALDLIERDEDGAEESLIRALLNYDDARRDYKLVFKTNPSVMELFQQDSNMDSINDAYFVEADKKSKEYIAKRRELSNNHIIRVGRFIENGHPKDYEYIHQQQAGDCILATTLNTLSFNENGHLPFTIAEMRKLAIALRKGRGKNSDDILKPDSWLENEDFIYLLSSLTARPATQKKIRTIDGENRQRNEVSLEVVSLLDSLAGSDYKTLAMGTRNHARALKDLGDEGYVLIDPLIGPAKKMSVEETVDFITNQCIDRQKNDNFFYII